MIVGAIDQDTVADLAARYIGTLPAGDPDQHVNHDPGFPPGIQRITIPLDADDRHSGLSLEFGAEVPVTVKTMVIADLISTLLDDLLESAVREELGEPYTVGASLWPLIEVGMWDNYLRASVPTENLEQTNSTVVETVAALIASRPAEADLAQAKSALRDRCQLDRNSEIIEALLQRRHLDDALVGTPEHRLAVLDEITDDDVQRYMSLFFNLDNRIELFRSAE